MNILFFESVDIVFSTHEHFLSNVKILSYQLIFFNPSITFLEHMNVNFLKPSEALFDTRDFVKISGDNPHKNWVKPYASSNSIKFSSVPDLLERCV